MAVPRSRISASETYRLVCSDFHAICDFHRKERNIISVANFLLNPGFLAITLHRIAHYWHRRGMKLLTRLTYFLGQLLTSADFAPSSRIGERFVMLHATGSIIAGKIGKNVLFTAGNGMGGDGSSEDIGAGPGLPVIGDYVVFGARANVCGPCDVGDHAFISAMSLVLKDVPAGATVFGIPARVIKMHGHNNLQAPRN